MLLIFQFWASFTEARRVSWAIVTQLVVTQLIQLRCNTAETAAVVTQLIQMRYNTADTAALSHSCLVQHLYFKNILE